MSSTTDLLPGADSDAPPPEVVAKKIEARTPLQLAWARFKRDKVAMSALIIIGLLILVAIFANQILDVFNLVPPNDQDFELGVSPDGLPAGPGGKFPLGADHLGRSILSRIIIGAQVSMTVGLAATLLALVIGIVLGLFAGYYGGWVDTLISRFMEIVLSFPLVLLAIAIAAIRGGGSLGLTIAIISFFGWVYIARIVRGQVLSLREKEFIEAARSLGASDLRIIFVDVLPNLIAPIIVYTTLIIPTNILLESALSFLGVGVPRPRASWGSMLADSLPYYRSGQWWYFTFPGVALFIAVLAFNLFGDGLRDALDPRAARTMAK
jgi:ABC-type dipeptide/oligopeptide/nickel transport system permease subunit